MAPASSDRRQAKLLRGPELQVRRQTGMTTKSSRLKKFEQLKEELDCLDCSCSFVI